MFRFAPPPQPPLAPIALRGTDALAEHRRNFPDDPLDLRRADLTGALLVGADLRGADLRGATLDDARLDGAQLHGVKLRDASLRNASLAGAHGLIPAQLAGTDLTGAELPAGIATERMEEAARCGDAADFARSIFMWMVGGCAFVWLMLISTTQLQLLTNDGVVNLPVFEVDAPSELFFVLGPFLVIGVYCYLHVYLQRIWETLGGLPAVFPDGEPIDRKTHGWMVLGLVRWQWRRLRERPRMFYSQTLLSVLLAWGLAPITVYSVWRRCAIRHDWNQSIIQVIACAAVAHVAIGSLLAARGAFTLRTSRLAHAAQWVVSLGVLYGLHAVMQDTFHGRAELGWFNAKVVHYHPTDRTPKWGRTKRELMNEYHDRALFLSHDYHGERDPGFTPEADSALVDLTRRWREAYAEFSGPLLRGAHLEGCYIDQSDLSSADLTGSRWTRATLLYADLTQANLQGARFHGANFNEVSLVGASAQRAEFTDASASGFYALGADLSEAKLQRFHAYGPPADLRKAVLDDADMQECQLSKARLQGASLKGVDLHGAILTHADLSDANLTDANLTGADLRGARLKGADLTGADLSGARFGEQALHYNGHRASHVTLLDDANLSGAKGLTNSMLAAATYNDATRWDNRPPALQVADAAAKPDGWEPEQQQLRMANLPQATSSAEQHLLFDPPGKDPDEGKPLELSPKLDLPQTPVGIAPRADSTDAASIDVDYSPATPETEWPSEAWPE